MRNLLISAAASLGILLVAFLLWPFGPFADRNEHSLGVSNAQSQAVFPGTPTAVVQTGGNLVSQAKTGLAAETNELLVTFKANVSEKEAEKINQKIGVRVLDTMFSGRIYHVKLPPGKSFEVARREYISMPGVDDVSPNYRVSIDGPDR